jgi:hypothetical protein
MPSVAHQRRIRDELAARDRVAPIASLTGCTVGLVSRSEARPLILRYEWLGDLGHATVCFGLLAADGELLGAVCFGYGPAGPIRKLIGAPALCLERGACSHRAPPNAASFLIARACKGVAAMTGTERFFAYCDPMAGEYGGVYQACNWSYLGQGLDNNKQRPFRTFVLAPGAEDIPANWRTTRALRCNGHRMGYEDAKARGWRIVQRPAKHVYAAYVGDKRSRREWLNGLGPRLTYPAPRPELKAKIESRLTEAPS